MFQSGLYYTTLLIVVNIILDASTYFIGILWPIEGMPLVMQYFTYLLPCTLATESIRSIISRGWGFTHFRVWPGFANSIIWIVIYWTATICIHRVSLAKK
jgi:ABC-type polysaccharide/polyol phosphate export permease